MLAREVVALTGPEMPIPGPEPKPKHITPYDQCAYCDWHRCERNPHHDAYQGGHSAMSRAHNHDGI